MSPSLPVTLSFSPCQCHPLSVIRYLSPSACHILVTMISQLPVTLAYLSLQSPSPCHPLRSEVSMSPFVCHAVHVTLYRCHPVSIFLSPRLSHPLLGTLWSRCNPISFILYSLPVMLSLSPYLAISVTLFLSGAGEEGGEVTTDTWPKNVTPSHPRLSLSPTLLSVPVTLPQSCSPWHPGFSPCHPLSVINYL